jgi:hypothetical protein
MYRFLGQSEIGLDVWLTHSIFLKTCTMSLLQILVQVLNKFSLAGH